MEALLNPKSIKAIGEAIAALPAPAKAFVIAAGGIYVIGKAITAISEISKNYMNQGNA